MHFLRICPSTFPFVTGDGRPGYLPEGVEAEAAEGEQQSCEHHLWGRQEGEVRMPVGRWLQ